MAKEIRMRWNPKVANRKDAPDGRDAWKPNTHENRAKMKFIIEVANEAFGAGSHWMEEREAAPKRRSK